MNSTCTICGTTFDARHSYGLCIQCYSSDRLRALDRVESAIRQARRNGIAPISLTTPEWLSVLSDHVGLCALCRKSTGSRILRFDRTKGLTYDNVVPCCVACEEHHINGFETAKERVRLYLRGERTPKSIPQNEEEAILHVEYS